MKEDASYSKASQMLLSQETQEKPQAPYSHDESDRYGTITRTSKIPLAILGDTFRPILHPISQLCDMRS
jgi:hypothetical protein